MRILRTLVPTLGLAVLASAPLAAQSFQTEGVVFSFMEMRLGSARQYALMPVAADTVRPEAPLTASIPNAFALLRNGKPATYCNASVRVTDEDLRNNRATVQIDPACSSFFELVAAETVYTFTQLGIERVVFPGLAEQGLTRDDVPYAAFEMRVPLWQAALGGRLYHTRIVMPDGSSVSSDELHTRMLAQDRGIQQALLAYLGQPATVPRYALLAAVPTMGIAGFEAAVIPNLQDPVPQLRELAVRALAQTTDTAALDALVLAMQQDPEPALRGLIAQTLAASAVESYRFYEIAFRIQAPDPSVRAAAIGELTASTDRRADEVLVAMMADADPAFAMRGVDALAQRSNWTALANSIGNAALREQVRLAAATALSAGASGDQKLAGLRYRGFNMTGQPAVAVLDIVQTLREGDPRATIVEFLAHPDQQVVVYAAGLLGTRGEAASLPDLAARVAAPNTTGPIIRACEDAAFQIARTLPSSSLDSVLGERDLFLRAAGFRALGAQAAEGRAGGDAFDRLAAGLQDSNPVIRAASAQGLGSFANAAALERLLAAADDREAIVQAAVARALGNFQGEAFAAAVNPIVVGFVQSGEPAVMAGALEALGMLNQVQLRTVVLANITFSEPEVRAAAMRASAMLADPANPRDAVNAIAAQLRDPDLGNRVLAAQLLGQFGTDTAIILISQVINDPVIEVRYAAIDALGRSRNLGAGAVLISTLEDPDRNVRMACVAALRQLNLRGTIPDVQAAVAREQDPATAAALQELLQALQTSGT